MTSHIESNDSLRFLRNLLRIFSFLLIGAIFAGCATTNNSEAMKRVRFEDTPDGVRAILDESILFGVGTSEFTNSANKVLDVLQPTFAKARKAFTVEGHTDSTGSTTLNQKLSIQRAERVRDAVIHRQIPPDKVIAKGYGASKPRRTPELNAEDRQLNRRAEFLFPGETVESLNARSVENQANDMINAALKGVEDAWNSVVGKEIVNGTAPKAQAEAESASPSAPESKTGSATSKTSKRKTK